MMAKSGNTLQIIKICYNSIHSKKQRKRGVHL